ncbi:MAG: RNA polymerase sigma factor [bacterium]|nr:RNA polymerase sigma factor [bacterium]
MTHPVTHPSFEDVATELSDPLQRYLARLAGSPSTAEDLLQETLLKIARALPDFEGRSSVKTWAFSIATRVAADYFRRPENRAHVVDVDAAGVPPEGDKWGDPPDPEDEVDDRLVFDEMNSCVRGVIDSLPEDYRAALVLHDLEGLTAAETAKVSSCSLATLATAKIGIHRARRRLKAALEQECSFYHDDQAVLRCDRKSACR